MPTANRAWMAPSCSSLAIRSRSSRTARRWSWPWRRPYSRATAACSAKVSTSCTSLSRSSGPPRPLATVSVPRMRPRTARGMNTAGPGPGGDDRLGDARVGPGVGQDHRLAGPDDVAGHRALGREDRPQQLAGQQPVGRLNGQALAVHRQGQGGQVGAGQRPGVPHDQPEQLAGVGPGQDGGADGPDGLEPLGAVVGLLVQVGRLDGRARLGGQQAQGPLVVGVEVLAAVLLGHVQVAVDPAAGP